MNNKGQLNEWSQKVGGSHPLYQSEVLLVGFRSTVTIIYNALTYIGVGEGENRRLAEQAAAGHLLPRLPVVRPENRGDQSPTDVFRVQAMMGYTFKKKCLLEAALTHPSVSSEGNYSRLAWFGDRVVNMIVAHKMFYSPTPTEGLTQEYSGRVDRRSLAKAYVPFTSHLNVRRGCSVEVHGYADAFEALLGAVYLDGGLMMAAGVYDRLC